MRLGAHCSLAVCPKTEAVSWEKNTILLGPIIESKAKLVALCCVGVGVYVFAFWHH